MKNKSVLMAVLVTLLCAVILTVVFSYWRERSLPKDSIVQLSLLENMEKNGIPAITAKTIDGRAVSTPDLRGKIVIINFWASWCGPCMAEVPSLIELVQAFPQKIELLAISEDDAIEDVNSFTKIFPKLKTAKVDILWDQDHSLLKEYGSERLPESFVVGKDGLLVKKIVGSINWHTKDSEAFIQELLDK